MELYLVRNPYQSTGLHSQLNAMQKAEEVAADVPEVADETMLSQEMLRKYITFAKQNCHPRLANANVEKITEVNC